MKYIDISEDRILSSHEEYLSGRPLKDIAKELGLSPTILRKRYKERNLRIPNISEIQFLLTSYKNKISPEQEQAAVDYYAAGGAIEETADKFKITCKRLRLLLEQNAIPLRSKGEQIKLLGEDFHKQRVANAQKAFKEKYGVKNLMHLPHVVDKVKAAISKHKREISTYILPDGELLVDAAERRGIAPTTIRNVWKRVKDPALVKQWIDNYDVKNTHTDIEVSLLASLIDVGLPAQRMNKSIPGVSFSYRPDLHISGTNIYIDCDGLYWHSDKFRDKDYHRNKQVAYSSGGMRCFQFRSDEILDKLKICTSIVQTACGKSEKIYARKCFIRSVGKKDSDLFFEENHLMGTINGATAVGLYSGNDLVLCVSYRIRKDGSLELSRVCTKIGLVVVGGFSRVLKHIEDLYPEGNIVSFVDLRYADGHSLTKLGFELDHTTIGFKWFKKNTTYNRYYCTANMDDRKLTEKEHAEEMGLSKIYDAGQALFIKRRVSR